MSLTDTTIATVRRISAEPRPSVLDDLGLFEALEWQSQQFQARTGILCNCECDADKVDLSQEQSTAVFRIFQEALTNVLRHAKATSVDVRIQTGGGQLVVSLRDNGRGITEEEKSNAYSLGLLGMRERAELIGARLEIDGVDGKGTELKLRGPVDGA